MVTPEEISAWEDVSTRAIYQWVEAGRVHFKEIQDGTVMICPASLPTGRA